MLAFTPGVSDLKHSRDRPPLMSCSVARDHVVFGDIVTSTDNVFVFLNWSEKSMVSDGTELCTLAL